MIVPSDDEFLDSGLVVERNSEPGQAQVLLENVEGETVSVWWDEDSWSAEIVWRRDDVEIVRIEWSCVEQLRLSSERDTVELMLVIPSTTPAPALTVQVSHVGVRIWSALPSSPGLYS